MGKLPAKTQKSDKREKRGGKRSTSWKPGQSGNPGGRPSAGMSWAELIIKIVEEQVPGKEMTWKEAVVRAAIHHAIKGNAAILKELWQRSEPQPLELNVKHTDWREQVKAMGLDESEVIAEAQEIINEQQSGTVTSD